MRLLPDFNTAAHAVLAYLHETLGFSLWMVTRAEGNDWIVLQARNQGYEVAQGDVFRWTDSFCSRMVRGDGPRIVPCSAEIKAYADAPIAQQIQIGAYIGVPLVHDDGSLFGTLCGIDPQPQPETIVNKLPLVELLASLLCGILHADLNALNQARLAEQREAEAMIDILTGIYNRRGWNYLLSKEEQRCGRYGCAACIIAIDLDDLKPVNDIYGHSAGDALLQRTAQVVNQNIRRGDVVARVGGDEFAILAVECSLAEGEVLADRIQQSLASVNVAASVGLAVRQPSQGLQQAWADADTAMYHQKRQRAQQRLNHYL